MRSKDMSKRGAFLHAKHGKTLQRTGAHKNRKREADRKACRKRVTHP